MNVETFLFSLLLIIAIFSGFGIRPFYIDAGLLLMSFSAISLVVQKRDKEEIHLFWLLVVWIAYHLFCALSSFSVRGIYICFQHIGTVFIFWFVFEGDKFKLLREEIKGLNRIIHWGVLLVLGFLIYRKSPNIAMYESYIYIGLVSIPFVIAEWKRMRRIRIICLCLIWFYVSYQVGARSQSVGFLLFILVAVLLLLFKGKGKGFLKKAFWGYYAFLNIFPMIYSYHDDAFNDAWEELTGEDPEDPDDRSQLLGWPDVIQNSMFDECDLVTQGYYLGDGWVKIPKEVRQRAEETARDRWMLLFQLDIVELGDFELMFGDCGHIYFYITKEDLAARRFDRIWLILQCY